MNADWDTPDGWRTVSTLDAHAGGEPLRIVTDGVPSPAGETMLEKRRYAERHLDEYRTTLLWEPRGHADMYGAVVTDPVTRDGDFGVLFLHNDGYSTMCGHGVIALAKVAVQTGFVEPVTPTTTVAMDTPAGLVTARVEVPDDGPPGPVTFENVPSFVSGTGCVVDVPELGRVEYDLAYGGAFYAYCDAADLGVDVDPGSVSELVRVGRAVKERIQAVRDVTHPEEEDLGFLYGTIICDDADTEGADSRNVCVFADGEVDRCPTGTGVSGRVALRAAAGEQDPGEEFVVESIVGSRFTGTFEERTTCGDYEAVVPRITGDAHVVGRSEFVVDPDDPLGEGFILR